MQPPPARGAHESSGPPPSPPRILKSNNPSISLAPPLAAIISSVLQQFAELHRQMQRNRFERIAPEMSFHVINKSMCIRDARINKMHM